MVRTGVAGSGCDGLGKIGHRVRLIWRMVESVRSCKDVREGEEGSCMGRA